jgi:hypothetical protein
MLKPSEKKRAKGYLKKLHDRLLLMKGHVQPQQMIENIQPAEQNIQEPEHQEPENDDAMAEQLLQQYVSRPQASNSASPPKMSTHRRIDRLKLNQKGLGINVSEYWKSRKFLDSDLYALYEIVFSIPPTQVSVERAFSALRLVLTYLRFNLCSSILEDILLIKLNSAMITHEISDESFCNMDE